MLSRQLKKRSMRAFPDALIKTRLDCTGENISVVYLKKSSKQNRTRRNRSSEHLRHFRRRSSPRGIHRWRFCISWRSPASAAPCRNEGSTLAMGRTRSPFRNFRDSRDRNCDCRSSPAESKEGDVRSREEREESCRCETPVRTCPRWRTVGRRISLASRSVGFRWCWRSADVRSMTTRWCSSSPTRSVAARKNREVSSERWALLDVAVDVDEGEDKWRSNRSRAGNWSAEWLHQRSDRCSSLASISIELDQSWQTRRSTNHQWRWWG